MIDMQYPNSIDEIAKKKQKKRIKGTLSLRCARFIHARFISHFNQAFKPHKNFIEDNIVPLCLFIQGLTKHLMNL